jgi:MFS family permease
MNAKENAAQPQQRGCSDELLVTVLLAGVLGGCIIGFVLGWLWVHHWRGLLGVRVLEVVTALGTCGAVVVALGLHRESIARSSREQRRRARLYALEMRVSLQYFQNLAQALCDLNFKLTSSSLSVEEIKYLDWLAGQILGFDQVRKMDIARFDCLSPRISSLFATGITQLAQGAMAVQATLKLIELRIDDSDAAKDNVIKEQVVGNHLWLSGGLDMFKRAGAAIAPEIEKAMYER